jgi:chemotaxis protein MotD
VQRELRPDSLQSTLQAYLAPRQDAPPPVRVLYLQLDPPQLGPVTIRISLKDTALSLQLEAQNQETASLINRDREALSGLLRSAGYTVDGLQIQTSGADRGMTGQSFGNQAAFGQAAGQQPGWRQQGARAQSRTWQEPRAQEVAAGQGNDRIGPQGGKPRGGSVYL